MRHNKKILLVDDSRTSAVPRPDDPEARALPGGHRRKAQIVPSIAFPIGLSPSRGQHPLFLYLSPEHPFRSAH